MWFLFGFLTISICICVEFWRRHLSRWKPENITSGLQYKHYRHKNQITQVYLGIACHEHANFYLKKQSWLDDFFKRMGVSNEFDTGDSSFDDLVYLVSDNKTLHHALANSADFRLAVKKIMNAGAASQLKVKEIQCRNGRLWAIFIANSNYSENGITTVAKTLADEFHTLASAIQDVAMVSGSRWKDPFVIKAGLLLAISSGLAINGGIQFARLQFGKLPFTVNYLSIVEDALIYSIGFILVFAVMALYWLGRSARAHLVLVEIMTIGAFGIFLSVATETRDMNIEMDTSTPQVFDAQVERKYTTRGRRSGTKYHVVVQDWRCSCGSYNLSVSEAIYRSISEHGSIQLLQHQGHFGYPWISHIKAL